MRIRNHRPRFDGDAVDLFTTHYPGKTKQETESTFKEIALELVNWILGQSDQFSSGDCFQIIVAWPLNVRETNRQVIWTGGVLEEVQEIADASGDTIELSDGRAADLY